MHYTKSRFLDFTTLSPGIYVYTTRDWVWLSTMRLSCGRVMFYFCVLVTDVGRVPSLGTQNLSCPGARARAVVQFVLAPNHSEPTVLTKAHSYTTNCQQAADILLKVITGYSFPEALKRSPPYVILCRRNTHANHGGGSYS